jgi:protein tyrosine/serine phosphatase
MVKLAKAQRRRMRTSVREWQVSAAAGLPSWLVSRFGPAVHYADLWLIDYGVIREGYANLHQVTDRIWRSAQPAPRHLRALAARGVRTVINLRGAHPYGAYWLEQQACARLGLDLVDIKLKSRAAPTRAELARIREAIAAIDGPTLIHCKSGSDRTGLFCGLYLILREGVPVVDARRQLGLRFGHISLTKTGVLDRFFDHYLDYAAREPIEFTAWLDTIYDPAALTASFRSGRWHRRTARALGLAR